MVVSERQLFEKSCLFLSALHTVRDLCRKNPCKNGGICWMTGKDYRCSCKPGYSGENCESTYSVVHLVLDELDLKFSLLAFCIGEAPTVVPTILPKHASSYWMLLTIINLILATRPRHENLLSILYGGTVGICIAAAIECRTTLRGLEYRGNRTTTRSGLACQNWHTQSVSLLNLNGKSKTANKLYTCVSP